MRTTKRLGQMSRDERLRTTYVAVTARRFAAKAAWPDKAGASNQWAGARVLDADDLAAWLTMAPGVGAWFVAEHLGAPAADLDDVDSYLRAWSSRTRPPLPPSLALSRRSEALKAFGARLEDVPGAIRIAADTREEAIVFAAAAVARNESLVDQRRKFRTVVVHTDSALRWAIQQAKSYDLLLLPTFPMSSVAASHGDVRVVVALDPEAAGIEVDVRLGPISRQAALAELVAAGVDEESARRLAAESEGRLSDLQRRLGYGYVERPEWARDEPMGDLMAMLLVGAFAPSVRADRAVLDALGGTGETVEQLCNRLQRAAGAPIVRKADVFAWGSHSDAWGLLARELTTSQIDAFVRASARFSQMTTRPWIWNQGSVFTQRSVESPSPIRALCARGSPTHSRG
jgi:hypothetical protein